MNIELKVLDTEFYSKQDLPAYVTPGSAGVDLRVTRDVTLIPGIPTLVGTGIAIAIGDTNLGGFIYPRSGLGCRGVVLGNSTGVIDSDYTGEITLNLLNRNTDKQHIFIAAGDRVAQLVLMPIVRADFEVVTEFTKQTKRGSKGFGSSGVK